MSQKKLISGARFLYSKTNFLNKKNIPVEHLCFTYFFIIFFTLYFQFHALNSSGIFQAKFYGNFWLGIFHGQLFASQDIFPDFFTGLKKVSRAKKENTA